MNNIYIFRNGCTELAQVEKLFKTHGPYELEGQRLDKLVKVQIISDSSTQSISQTGKETTKANTGEVIGRAIVGGVLLGGAGAVVGGMTGSHESKSKSSSRTLNKVEYTVELIFEEEVLLYVLVKSQDALHWLLSFVNQPSLTTEEVQSQKNMAIQSEQDSVFIKGGNFIYQNKEYFLTKDSSFEKESKQYLDGKLLYRLKLTNLSVGTQIFLLPSEKYHKAVKQLKDAGIHENESKYDAKLKEVLDSSSNESKSNSPNFTFLIVIAITLLILIFYG
jgi:hypothetical protein